MMLKPVLIVAALELSLVLLALGGCRLSCRAIQRRWRAIWATQRYRIVAVATVLVVVISQLSAHMR